MSTSIVAKLPAQMTDESLVYVQLPRIYQIFIQYEGSLSRMNNRRLMLTGAEEPLSAAGQTRPCRIYPFALQPTATAIHNVLKRRPNFITINQYSRRNQSCENPILLFLLKTKLVFVSLLNYTIGGVCTFFIPSCLFFCLFFTFFISSGHDLAVAVI